ncbi:uncharacterized protein DUF3540 [Biostraticola tofi]|uniref:Uncharacterized protein DUF3540 n=2 Tax=Biostraticola tofi TaxID=466109 RepID=A0A4R3YZT4_9GAMM|nr:uncharacterized protein DUF3540 [Biostraticola tofi]
MHMDTISDPPARAAFYQGSGKVLARLAEGRYLISFDNRTWQCQLAASCLLRPEAHDEVLLAGDDDRLWLLAVLLRADSSGVATLGVSGDLLIAPAGNLQMSSAGQIGLNCQRLALAAERGECRIEQMNYTGQALSVVLQQAAIVGKSLETLWHTATQISHRLLRCVTHKEQVRAGQIDIQAEDCLRFHSKNTLISAEALIKIDAEQIHMG